MSELSLSDSRKYSLNEMRDCPAQLRDSRQPGKVHHSLPDLLLSALCAMVCGCEDFTSMATFAKHRLEWLREFLPLENGAPSHDTCRNIFMMVNPDEFAEVLPELRKDPSGERITIDGKAMRSSYDPEKRKCLLHLLRVRLDDRSLCAGRVTCK